MPAFRSQNAPAGAGPRTHGRGRKPWPSHPIVWATPGLLLLVLLVGFSTRQTPQGQSIPYSALLEQARRGAIDQVAIDQPEGTVRGLRRDHSTFWSQGPRNIPEADINLLQQHDVRRDYEPPPSNVLGPLLWWLILLVTAALFLRVRLRPDRGRMVGVANMGQSRAKVHIFEESKPTFADVAGYAGVKEEIAEVVDFLRSTPRYAMIGARIPKGVLLMGPPGTGKTLLARAVASEAKVPFISVSGSDFMEMFVGVGAARVRDLFETARRRQPAIVFVDEIDSIGRTRGAGIGGGGDEREQTLNQLLSELDGFEAAEGVVVLAATNRPEILDPALLRAGRFDRQIPVPLPTVAERRAILDVHCRSTPLADDVDLDLIARAAAGMSGADLANLVNEATLTAARRGAGSVWMSDFDSARDRVTVGSRRDSLILSDEEKELVAYHEGGHAVLAHLLPLADPLHKVTILPTGTALGVTQQLPVEERHLHQQEYIEDSMAVRLGGRAAEALVFGAPSTGANDDLVDATLLARKMVQEWGMSKRVGPRAWASRGATFPRELPASRGYSEQTARIIDEEIGRILRRQEHRARQELQRHRVELEAVARALIERETLDGAEVARLIRGDEVGPESGQGATGKARTRGPSEPCAVTPARHGTRFKGLPALIGPDQHPQGPADGAP